MSKEVGESPPAANGADSRGIPGGFKVDAKGVYCLHDQEWIWVCSQLEVVALSCDERGDEWGKLLRFRDPNGRQHEWAMPSRMLHGDGSEYRERLLDMGLRIGYGRETRGGLHGYLSGCNPKERATAVTRLGWHDALFIMPDRVFGTDAGRRVVLQVASPLEHALRTAGTLKDWRENVGILCIGNSRLVFGLSSAFVAPLLDLVNEESGGVHLRGGSSIGKTTILDAAASTHGGGGIHGYRRSWRATVNGIEAIAAAHCDLFLPLDEIGQVDSKDAGAAAYQIANGLGKHRARRDGSGRPAATWRTFLFSTGEISLADKIGEDGRRRVTGGQEIRVLDIPADAGKGLGAFEDLHGEANGDEFSRRLRTAASQFYGTPLIAFLEAVTSNLTEWAAWVEKVRHGFEADLNLKSVDGQVSRAIGRFSLIAAAGELATKLGITGWPEGEASNAVATCFEAWLDRRGSTGPAEIEAGIRQVRHFIEQHGESRFAPWDEDPARPTINRAGFRKRTEEGIEFFVLPESWREICTGFDAGLIARELIKRDLLIPGPDGKPQRPELIPGLGEKKKRVYRLSSRILSEE